MKTTHTHQILTPHNPHYPASLRHIPQAPSVLFARGNLDLLSTNKIAIVGARHPTPDGLDNAYAFAKHLAECGFCIVSGLAQGIDGASHEGALDANMPNGSTIAVLGCGIDIIYPRTHQKLADRIIASKGLIISEFPPGTPPIGRNFPKRNRIVAGLSSGVLVVEAALKSGSLITARLANDMGREVFAMPGSIHSPLSRGPHYLIQQGAKLVENVTDILSEIIPSARLSQSVGFKSEKYIDTSDAVTPSLLNSIGYDAVSEQTLLRRSKMSLAQFGIELLTLEMQGLILRQSDGRITKIRHSIKQ